MLEKVPQTGLLRKLLDWTSSESGKSALLSLIIVFVGLSGYSLGRLSAVSPEERGFSIREAPLDEASPSQNSAATIEEEIPSGGEVVASKNGSKYHFPWCSGAKAINEANKITFSSTDEARKAGYTPASNCKGLR